MTIYLEHFGLREAPFRITPHTEFFFAGSNRGETLEALLYAITSGEGIVKVVGEVGSGKTMLCRVLMERLPETVETIYLVVPSLSRDEMLAVVAGDLGIDTTGSNTTKIIRALQARLIEIHEAGRQVVALIDEAHAMPMETLEEIRLLSNLETSHQKLMQIVLFGQPELDTHLAQPHMRQLKERITHSFNLRPLPAGDIREYIGFRLRAAGYKGPDLFSKEALSLIAEASEGLTRRINIYADKTLLAAYAEGTHTITGDHARAAINDTRIAAADETSRTQRPAWLPAGLGLAAGLVIGWLAGPLVPQQFHPFQTTTTASAAAQPATAQKAPPVLASPAASQATSTVDAKPGEQGAAPAPAAVTPSPPAASADAGKLTTKTSTTPEAPVQVTREVATVKPAQVASLEKRIQDDAARLADPPGSRWTIQLMLADSADATALESYLGEAGRQLGRESLLTYAVGAGEKRKIGVVYGDFGSRKEAQAELSRLTTRIGQFKPYARTFQAVREDAKTGR